MLTLTALDAYALHFLKLNTFSFRPFLTHRVTMLVVEPHDNSFPCLEVMIAATLATMSYAVLRMVGVITWFAVLLFCVARVFCGANYPKDVFVGMALGLFWAALSLRLCGVPFRLRHSEAGK